MEQEQTNVNAVIQKQNSLPEIFQPKPSPFTSIVNSTPTTPTPTPYMSTNKPVSSGGSTTSSSVTYMETPSNPSPNSENIIGVTQQLSPYQQQNISEAQARISEYSPYQQKNLQDAINTINQRQGYTVYSSGGFDYKVKNGTDPLSVLGKPQPTTNNPSIQLEYPSITNQVTPSTTTERFSNAVQDRSIFSAAPQLSIGGTINYVAGELGRLASKVPFEQLPLLFQNRNVEGYKDEYGNYVKLPTMNANDIPSISNRINSQRESVAADTKETATGFFATIPYFIPQTAPLAFLSGLEDFSTPAGKADLAKQSENFGALAYAFPAMKVLGGLAGTNQLISDFQANSIKNINPANIEYGKSIIKPDSRYSDQLLMLTEVKKNIPPYGFKQAPINLDTGNPVYGSSINSIVTNRLNPIGNNMYQIEGVQGRSIISIENPINGRPTINKIDFTGFGDLEQADANIVTNIKGATQIKPIPNAFKGNLMLTTADKPSSVLEFSELNNDIVSAKSSFGGFPIKTNGQNSLVVSGDLNNGILEPRVITQVKSLNEDIPKVFRIMPSSTKGQVSLFSPSNSLSPTEIVSPTSLNGFELPRTIANEVSKLSMDLIGANPIISFGLKLPTKSSENFIELPKVIDSNNLSSSVKPDVSTKSILSLMNSSETKQVETPISISNQNTGQPSVQIQPQPQPQVQKQIQITPQQQTSNFGFTPINPIPVIPFGLMKGKSKRILSSIKTKRQAYDVFVRRKGKYEQVGKNLPIGRAEQLGSNIVLRDLSRTFKLVEDGTTDQSDVPFKISSQLFRSPKNREALTFIQKRALNRGSGEVSKIIKTRRNTSMFGSRLKTRRIKLFK